MKPLFQKFNFSINWKKHTKKIAPVEQLFVRIRNVPASQRSTLKMLLRDGVILLTDRDETAVYRPRATPARTPSNASLLDRFLVDPKVPPTTNIGHVSNFNRSIHIHTIGPIGTSSHWHVINVFSHHVAFGLFRGGMTWQWRAIWQHACDATNAPFDLWNDGIAYKAHSNLIQSHHQYSHYVRVR